MPTMLPSDGVNPGHTATGGVTLAPMGRISRTITLAKASWAVLRTDTELVLLPVISAIASTVVAASFIVPLFVAAGGATQLEPGNTELVVGFVLYLVLAYITIFFNAALVHGANERLAGGDPTLGSAIRGAMGRAGAILPWALLSATVSLILRAIEERFGMVARIVAGLVGLAWTLITYLVVPILVIEGVGVAEAVKRSSEMFKRTWGENVAGNVGFGLLGFLGMVPGFAIGFYGITLGNLFVLAIAVIWLVLVAVVVATMSGIYQTALYRYAKLGSAGGSFDNAALASSFEPKHRRLLG